MEYEKYRHIPNSLRMYRRITGLSQKEVGERLGIDPDWLCRWESGDTLPNLISAFRLACFFGVELEALFSDLKASIRREVEVPRKHR